MYSTLVNFLATNENNIKDRDMHNNFNQQDNEWFGPAGFKKSYSISMVERKMLSIN
jgi:hypothetical protein